MLKYFFEKSSGDNRKLFNGLNIEKEPRIIEMQGKYPVIFLTFKDLKNNSFDIFNVIYFNHNERNYEKLIRKFKELSINIT